MTWFHLATYRGQLDNRGILDRIRKKIEGRISIGQCVLVDLEDLILTPDQLGFLMSDWPAAKVRFRGAMEALPSPLPRGVTGFSCCRPR